MIFDPALRHLQEEIRDGETLMKAALANQFLQLSLLSVQEVVDEG